MEKELKEIEDTFIDKFIYTKDDIKTLRGYSLSSLNIRIRYFSTMIAMITNKNSIFIPEYLLKLKYANLLRKKKIYELSKNND
jgi:hypothetical protein